VSDAGALAMPGYARVGQPADLRAALGALGVGLRRPVLVSVGGADGMAPEHLAVVATALREQRIVAGLDRWGAVVVDGGTDAGVMKVMGQAREAAGGHFPLVGVAAEGTVVVPGTAAAPGAARLDLRHTQVILVPGDSWGDESPWLSRVATVIAAGRPSATLVVNGGETTYDDVRHSLQAGRPVIVVAGTGRTADAIAAAARGQAGDSRAAAVAASPGTRIVPLGDPRALYSAIESVLAPRG
jgi:hypothetical protein